MSEEKVHCLYLKKKKNNVENRHAYQLLIFSKKLIKLGLKSVGFLI